MRIGKAYFKVVDLVLAGLSFLVLAVTTIWLLTHWSSIPDVIPTHFDASGQPDATGSKSNLWTMPAMSWGIWLILTVVDFLPGTWNMRGNITSAAGKAKAISLTRTFLQVIKSLIVIMFSYMMIQQAQSSALSPLLIPISIFLLMGASVVHIVFLSRLQ